MAPAIYALESAARDYAWGSPTAIPTLLGVAATGRPVAELWFGAHPDEPSRCPAAGTSLDQLIRADPAGLLGPDVAARFEGTLPFLLKVLAAGKALSIQVHPSLAQARAGFADEQARGVPLDSPARNYRDANHKPELLCALTEFDALCGLRPVAGTLELLAALDVAELDPLRAVLAGPGGLRAAFELLLDTSAGQRASLVAAAQRGCQRIAATGGPWALAAQAGQTAAGDFPGDIGAVLALLLNAVRLAPGEAIYLGAGNIHAYLRGMGVEIMANSDNVLRCGLTPKHVDVPEVLRIAQFRPLLEPRRTPRPAGPGERVYDVAVPDFELSSLEVDGDLEATVAGPQILLCTAGSIEVIDGPDRVELAPGRAAFVAAATPIRLTGHGTAFRATTPRDTARDTPRDHSAVTGGTPGPAPER